MARDENEKAQPKVVFLDPADIAEGKRIPIENGQEMIIVIQRGMYEISS
jgi:hypothetical protein